MNELVKIDPKEFGLEEKNVKDIEDAFTPKITERDGLAVIYEQVIKKELTPSLCYEASNLRKKLVKVRTGIADIHKTQKAYFLAAGKFCDAWKNKETLPVTQMEEKLSEIEKHFEQIEAERIAKLESERVEKTNKYTEFPTSNLGLMENSVFDSYLVGLKVAYAAKIKVEKEAKAKRIKNERLDKLESDRRNKAMEYRYFWNMPGYEFRKMTDGVFNELMDSLKTSKIEHEKEQKRIKDENERLRQEAEKKEKELEIERKKQAELLVKERAESEAKQKAIEESSRKEREKAEIERKRLESELFEKERKEKEEAKRISEEKLKAEKAPDKDKIVSLISGMVFPEQKLQTIEAIAVYNIINEKFEAFKNWAIKQTESI